MVIGMRKRDGNRGQPPTFFCPIRIILKSRSIACMDLLSHAVMGDYALNTNYMRTCVYIGVSMISPCNDQSGICTD